MYVHDLRLARRVFVRLGFFLLVLGAWSLGADPPPSSTAPDATWEGMYAAWKDGGETSLREFVRRNRPAVTPERIKDLALQGRKERSDAALSEARLAIALAAAREIGNPAVEADVLVKAGQYHLLTGGIGKALPLFDQALAVSRGLGDLSTQGDALEGRASAFARTGEPDKARADNEEALALYEKAGNLSGQSRIQRNLGELCMKAGDKAQAQSRFEKALSLGEQAGDAPTQAAACRSLGILFMQKGEQPKALSLLEKAVPLFEKADDPLGLGNTYFSLGDLHQRRSDYAQALAMFDKALPLFEKANDPLGQGNVYRARGALAYKTVDFPQAWALFEKARACYEKAKDVMGQGFAWLQMARIAHQRGDNAQALELCSKALPFFEKAKIPLGQGQVNLVRGLVLNRMGENSRAVEAYRDALRFFRSANSLLDQGTIHNFLGDIYARMGNFAQALAAYEEAVPLLEKCGSLGDLGGIYSSIGIVHHLAGDFTTAQAMFEKAISCYEKINHPLGLGSVYMLQGDIHRRKGDLDQALRMYEKALPLFGNGSSPVSEAEAYEGLGAIYAQRGDEARARALFEKALPLYDQVNSASGRGHVCLGLGGLDLRRGRSAQALARYEQALACFRQCEDPQTQATALAGVAQAQARAGRNGPALTGYEESLDLLERIRRRTGLEELKLSFMELVLEQYENAAGFMLEKGFGENAFRTAERMKARLFLDRLAEGLVDLEKGVDPESRKTRDDLEAKLGALRKQLQELTSTKLTEEERARRTRGLSEEIGAAEKALSEVKARIRLHNPLYASVEYPEAPSSAELRERVLREGEVLLEYFLTKKEAWCFVLSRRTFDVVKLPGTPTEIGLAVAELVDWAAADGRGGSGARPAPARTAPAGRPGSPAERLADILVTPLGKRIAGLSLIIVPDGALARLPFEMLSVRTGRGRALLARLHPVRYAQSAAVLTFYRTKYRRAGASDRFAGFGDPVYDHESYAARRAERGVTVTGGGLTGGQARRGMERAGVTLARLPGTGEEVKAIGTLFDRMQKGETSFLRLEASEEQAKRADLSGYGYLHFAAHGLLDDDYQAIALSQVPGASEDGFLGLSEIMNLQWDARVVVLSACETGLGKVRRGEGVTGLTRAVMYAGSPAAVVSLWSVSDEGTKELMTRFYGAMLGKRLPPADALRQAKLEMAASEEWRSPYYWAAFVLYGE